MRKRNYLLSNADWLTIFLYLALVCIGFINIYSAVYDSAHQNIFDLTQRHGKQLLWIVASLIIAIIILSLDAKLFSAFSYLFYGISLLLLIAVLLFGNTIAGSRSWFQFGSFAIQPSEFTKFATSLALAKYLSGFGINLSKIKHIFRSLLIIGTPVVLIFLQADTGTALVFLSFVLVLFREGFSGKILTFGIIIPLLFTLTLLYSKFFIISLLVSIFLILLFFVNRSKQNILILSFFLLVGVCTVFSVDYAFDVLLEPHQKKRINVLIGKELDPQGAGYNVNQSKIAIGSGGLKGKGFLEGTQTKFNFVPEQSTDFIFCTVGEEWGFAGSIVTITIFLVLLLRLLKLAERQRSSFSRIYGYCVASVLFFHFMVNIGMTIGLTPVIGIPLPFLSYGGSSLWAFTILLFIFIKQDASRLDVL